MHKLNNLSLCPKMINNLPFYRVKSLSKTTTLLNPTLCLSSYLLDELLYISESDNIENFVKISTVLNAEITEKFEISFENQNFYFKIFELEVSAVLFCSKMFNNVINVDRVIQIYKEYHNIDVDKRKVLGLELIILRQVLMFKENFNFPFFQKLKILCDAYTEKDDTLMATSYTILSDCLYRQGVSKFDPQNVVRGCFHFAKVLRKGIEYEAEGEVLEVVNFLVEMYEESNKIEKFEI